MEYWLLRDQESWSLRPGSTLVQLETGTSWRQMWDMNGMPAI